MHASTLSTTIYSKCMRAMCKNATHNIGRGSFKNEIATNELESLYLKAFALIGVYLHAKKYLFIQTANWKKTVVWKLHESTFIFHSIRPPTHRALKSPPNSTTNTQCSQFLKQFSNRHPQGGFKKNDRIWNFEWTLCVAVSGSCRQFRNLLMPVPLALQVWNSEVFDQSK